MLHLTVAMPLVFRRLARQVRCTVRPVQYTLLAVPLGTLQAVLSLMGRRLALPLNGLLLLRVLVILLARQGRTDREARRCELLMAIAFMILRERKC